MADEGWQESFTAADSEVVSRERVYNGFFKMEKLRLRHRRFQGGWTPEFSRELFARGDAACVLPYDPVRDEVVLLEQFRVGALGHPQSPWLLELVAGMIETGETPIEVVHREAQEEAGIDFVHVEFICNYLVSPGGTNEKIYLYCGQADTSNAGGIFGLEHENEDIRAHVLSVDQALAAMTAGRVNNAAAIIALQWLSLNRTSLRQRWSS